MRLGWVLALSTLACAPVPAAQPAEVPAAAAPKRVTPRPAPLVVETAAREPTAPSEVEPPPASPRFREPLVPRDMTRAVVLLYHAFDRGAVPLSVRSEDLEQQLSWLEEHHVEIVSTSELVHFLTVDGQLPARVAVITIDDGYQSVYARAWPVLQRHGARFTLGLPTGILDRPVNAPVMSWDEIREMVGSGLCEIASHGHMHRGLSGLGGPKLREELVLSRQIIEERLGVEPVAYFYPLGAFDKVAARAVAKAGYPAAFRASGAPIVAGGGSKLWLPRVSVFHGQTAATISGYYDSRFLGRVAYSAHHDPGAKLD